MITEIRANARVSFKQMTQSGDVFYTFEYGESRTINEETIEEDKKKLWEDVNNQVNNQILEVKQLYSQR